jgi:hypothetical protein
VLSEYLHAVLGFEFTYEPRVPVRNMHDFKIGHRKLRKTNQSSLAIPRSLQHRINALLLHPSVAVGIPDGSK